LSLDPSAEALDEVVLLALGLAGPTNLLGYSVENVGGEETY